VCGAAPEIKATAPPIAVRVAGPVLDAVAGLVHVVLIAAGVIVGLGTAALGGLLAYRLQRPRIDAARAMPPLPMKVARAAQPLPPPQRPAIEAPREVHLHLHGVSAEDVAAILARERLPGPNVNRPGPPHVP
jgi:hypothetical protein